MSLQQSLRRRNFQFDPDRWNDLAYLKAVFGPMIAGVHTALHEGRKPNGAYTFRSPMPPAAWIILAKDIESWARDCRAIITAVKARRTTKAVVRAVFEDGLALVSRLEHA
jgi:hypothetical protein